MELYILMLCRKLDAKIEMHSFQQTNFSITWSTQVVWLAFFPSPPPLPLIYKACLYFIVPMRAGAIGLTDLYAHTYLGSTVVRFHLKTKIRVDYTSSMTV